MPLVPKNRFRSAGWEKNIVTLARTSIDFKNNSYPVSNSYQIFCREKISPKQNSFHSSQREREGARVLLSGSIFILEWETSFSISGWWGGEG